MYGLAGDVPPHLLIGRVTRSGRCYPLLGTPAAAVARSSRASRSTQDQSVSDLSECGLRQVANTTTAADGADDAPAALGRPTGQADHAASPVAGKLGVRPVETGMTAPALHLSDAIALSVEAVPLEPVAPTQQVWLNSFLLHASCSIAHITRGPAAPRTLGWLRCQGSWWHLMCARATLRCGSLQSST